MGTIVGKNIYSINSNVENLVEELIKNGSAFNVWQAVWIAETITRKLYPERKEFLLEQTGIKFRPWEKYEFPPADIKRISFDDYNFSFILTFLGLYGINSPLPRCYHEQVAVQQRTLGKDSVPLQNFLDIFNNRFYWLYYQSWKKYRFYLFINKDTNNKILNRINSFTGRSIFPRERELVKIQKEYKTIINNFALLKFAAIFTQRSRNKSGLTILLSYFFPNIKMRVKEFVPHWIELNDTPSLEEGKFKLGENCYIGNSVKDYMSRICIEIGPVTFEEYLNFLPRTKYADKLVELLRSYLNDSLQFDFEFKIKTDTIVMTSWDDDRLKLGSSIWLGKPEKDEVKVYLGYEEVE